MSDAGQRKFDMIAREFTRRPRVEMGTGRRGFGSDALNVDGRIFAMLRHGRLVVKLPAPRVAALVAAAVAEPFDAGKGRPMKEWAVIDMAASDAWPRLVAESLEFATRAGGGKP